MKIWPKTVVRCLGLALAGLVIHCSGVLDKDNPFLGVFYLESITIKIDPNNSLLAEAPNIGGELTVRDTLYEMFYGLPEPTGDELVDNLLADKHFSGPYEFIGADRESLRLHNMPHVDPYRTDWWYQRTTTRLTLDNEEYTQVWIYRYP